MINTVKKRLNRKGFTLAEVLVTVAIIIILAGVTFVSVAQYQKNLRLMEMDGTAKEIFIAAQNHLSVAKASGDLDRLAEDAKESGSTPASSIGTKLEPAPSYADNASGEYYYVIHNVTSGTESYTPTEGKKILEMMLPFGALDETVATSGNYAIVYELKSASVVAVLYSGAGNASFGNAAVITLDDGDVKNIEEKKLYQDKSARKSYEKNGVSAIVGCYTGTAGSAAIPTETLEAPKLEVKNENKLHVLVREAKNTDNITLLITGEQSGTTARRLLNRDAGADDGYKGGTFDVTLDDITGDGVYRFSQLINEGRFKPDIAGSSFIPGENIIISAIASSTTALATPKESAKYTVSSLFDDVNEMTNAAGDTKVYIKNLRHLENLGVNVSGFTAAFGKGTTSGHYNVVNITAVQKNDITMFSFEGLRNDQHIYGSGTFTRTYIAANVGYPLSYDGGNHEIYDLTIAGYHRDGDEANAGIFGTVTSALSVKNLVLRNDKIPKTSISANAGMLLGKTSEDMTVDGVLAYYHEDEYDSEHDSAVEVQASQVAGGLIGLVDGGKLSVKNSAAAVYVKGGSAAGGFIGSVVGAAADSTIVQSYAGGHTKNGAYSTTDAANQPVLEDPGRYNVQASGNAGGFIGVTTNQVQMDNIYATTSVYSSSYSDNNKCSGSFAGAGTLNIPVKTEKDGSTKKHYYAIGPHNGVDVTKEELACAKLAQGQAHRQATPYDRKLVLKDKETAHPQMDKTSYPLCTVRNLCEGDASVKDADLPWFIKEHVGDWVEQSDLAPEFDVENGNRLTLRIDTGLSKKQITATQENENIDVVKKYGIKVHGVISNQDAYFLITFESNSVFNDSENKASVVTKATVKRGNQYNNTSWADFDPIDIANGLVEVDDSDDKGNLSLRVYLDDITRKHGHFKDVCPQLYPGEDITIKVAYVTDETAGKDVKFQDSNIKEKKTNSLFGSLEQVKEPNSNNWSNNDRHNIQKISELETYYDVKAYKPKRPNDTDALKDVEALGLVPASEEGKYYVQIDNSRHLENLSPSISGYPWVNNNPLKESFIGAIQTDDIYWSGESTAYTKGFREELGESLSVWSADNSIKSTDGGFSPLDYNQSVQLYDGGKKCIYGLNVNESGNASLFTQPNSDLEIKNLSVSDSSFISISGLAGGLVGYTGSKLTLNYVMFTNVTVKGNGGAGGFVAQSNSELSISNSGISSGNIEATNGEAGGIAGYTGAETTIKNATFNGKLTVRGANSSGGIIGKANGKVTVDQATFEFESDVMVEATSENVHAGGIVGYAIGEAEIKNTIFNGRLTVSGENSSAGIIGKTNVKATINHATFKSDVTVMSKEHAAGVLGEANSEADIENVTYLNKLIVDGNKSSGGILGNTGSKMKLQNINISGAVTVTSAREDAGGVFGFAMSSDTDIQNVKFIGKDTEVIARKNAGGLCGTLTGNSILTISNVAVSGFIQAEDNAGGLIGQLNTTAYQGELKNSYYGGRTKKGQYGPIRINNNAEPYTSNIHGNKAAGGLIGYIENVNGLTIKQCFSTGSVGNTNQGGNETAGGFIGYINGWDSKVKLENCYSMGTVSGPNSMNGGFIGNMANNNVQVVSGVYYLKTFNGSRPATPNVSVGKNIITVDKSDMINGLDGVDLSEQTVSYDPTLPDQYPYKTWTTDWITSDGTLTYYGDWPAVPEGTFVYYEKYKDGTYGFYYYSGGVLYNTLTNKELEKDSSKGYGVLSQFVEREKVGKLFSWYYSETNKTESEFDHFYGSTDKPQYDVVEFGGMSLNLFKVTSGYCHPNEGDLFTDNKTMASYSIKYIDGKPLFILRSGA